MELKEVDTSALMELGNIGASHAATALYEITSEKVELTSPSMITLGELKKNLNSSSIACTYSTLFGGVKAFLLFVFQEKNAISLTNKILGTTMERSSISELDGPPLQKITMNMTEAFAKALEEFFGKEILFTVPLYKYGDLNLLDEFLNRDILFFYVEFRINKNPCCYLILSLTKEDIEKLMESQIPEFEEFGSFGEMLGTFDKLLKIESRIEGLIKNKIPVKEIRDFLRAIDDETFERNPLKRYLEKALVFVGIGEKITINRKEPLKYEVIVEDCNICKDLPNNNKKSCFTTNTALGRFFRENLNIGNEVIETHCIKTGDFACVHLVMLEQIDVFSYLHTKKDVEILKLISKNGDKITFDEILKEIEDAQESLKILEYYGLVDREEEGREVRITLTELGKVFLIFVENAPEKSEEYIENWNDVSMIDKIVEEEEVCEEEKAPWEE